jgi:serpin B
MKLFLQRLWCCAVGLSIASSLALAQQSSSTPQQVNSASLGFGFRLVKELARQAPAQDVFISPFSISSVLQMLSSGAHGRTEHELRQVLGTLNLSAAEVNAAYQAANRGLNSQTNSTLNIANALWYRAGAALNPEFAQVNRTYYGAELSSLDFSSPSSASLINEWADRATRGKIPQIVSAPLAPNTAMILASAIYFKGTWEHQFDSKQTRDRAFHLTDGAQVPLPMMLQTRSWLYRQGDGYQSIQMPYAGGKLAMQVLLPATNSTVQVLLQRIDPQFWQTEILTPLREERGTLLLPKFTLRYESDLKGPLTSLGLTRAFGPTADFSGISSGSLFVSQIKHQAFVDVNEQGTEAAAVTTGVVALTAFRNQPPPFEMIVDRPFIFAISDLSSRSVLFLGVVYKPAVGGR